MGLMDTLKGMVMNEEGKPKLGAILTGIAGAIVGLFSGGGGNLIGALVGAVGGFGAASFAETMLKRRQEGVVDAAPEGAAPVGKGNEVAGQAAGKQPNPMIAAPPTPPNPNQNRETSAQR